MKDRLNCIIDRYRMQLEDKSWFGFSSPWEGNVSRSSKSEGWRSMLIFGRPVRFGLGRCFHLQYYYISDMFRPMLVFIKLWMTENIQMLAVQVVTIPKRKSQMKSKSKSWYYSPSFLLPALARPSAPAPPSPGKACPAWCSPWSPWSPMNATSLVRGAWWNSLLLFSRISAWLELIHVSTISNNA